MTGSLTATPGGGPEIADLRGLEIIGQFAEEQARQEELQRMERHGRLHRLDGPMSAINVSPALTRRTGIALPSFQSSWNG